MAASEACLPEPGAPSSAARTQGVALATRDGHIIEYGKLGFLRVVAL